MVYLDYFFLSQANNLCTIYIVHTFLTKISLKRFNFDNLYTEGSRLMLLLGPGKNRISQKSH